jgi:sugar phosphate isomerase/epimerase
MKLGFTTLGCPEWKLEEIAPRAKVLGFDGVELRVADDGLHLKPSASNEELLRTKALFDEAGMPIFALCAYGTYSSADPAHIAANSELTRKLIAIASVLGAKAIRCYGGKFENEPVSAVASRIGKLLRPLAKEAADKGVTIAIETHTFWARGADVLQIMQQVDSPGVGVLFDVNNTFTATGEWRQTYRLIRDYISYCHLKDDYVRANGKRAHVMLGAGDLPLAEVLAQLKQDGFAGYLSFEWERRWEPDLAPAEQVFPQYVRKVRRTWEQV